MSALASPARQQLAQSIEKAVGSAPQRIVPLTGGCVGEVYRVDFAAADPVVVKVAAAGGLAVEGRMLSYLRRETTLPVPGVLACDDRLLAMDFVPHDGRAGASAERRAAEQLAQLHGTSAPAYGFAWDTVIAALPQPNGWSADWIGFLRDKRLMHIGRLAYDAGRLDAALFGRLERFCARLEDWLAEPAKPALIHGDVWRGNLLFHDGAVVAYIDPAIYFAPAEMELAFIDMLSCFGADFYDRYDELRPIDPDFWAVRRHIYSLYPLLVHSRLFGAPYRQQVAATLARFL